MQGKICKEFTMRNIFIILFLIILSTISYGEGNEDFVLIKKDEGAPFDGMLVSLEKFKELIQKDKEYKILLEWYGKLDKNLTQQVLELETPVTLLKEHISLVEQKYTMEKTMRMDLLRNYNQLKNKTDILVITNAIGWGAGISALLGVCAYALLAQ